jgi:positive regulator of sigma E activity
MDGSELDRVVGGYAAIDCPKLTSCGSFSECNSKESCLGKVS